MRYGTAPSTPGSRAATPNDLFLTPGSGQGPVVLNNVAPGSLGATSLQAVNGAQINKISSNIAAALGGGARFDEASGTVTAPTYIVQGRSYNNAGSAFEAVDSSLSSIGADVSNLARLTTQLSEQVSKNRKIAAGGIAGAIASSQVRYDDRPGRMSLGIGGGFYDRQGALAVGFGGTSENGRWRYNASVNFAPGIKKIGVGAGLSYSW